MTIDLLILAERQRRSKNSLLTSGNKADSEELKSNFKQSNNQCKYIFKSKLSI
jgi:hypothetical protein